MKTIAGSIVVLSGTIAFCAGMAVDAFEIRPDGTGAAMVGGVVLLLLGVGLIAQGVMEGNNKE